MKIIGQEKEKVGKKYKKWEKTPKYSNVLLELKLLSCKKLNLQKQEKECMGVKV